MGETRSEKKYIELGKNTAIFAISLTLSKMVSSLLIPLYTRTMTTEEYGIVDLIITISGFIIPIFSLSIHEAVFRFGLDRAYEKKQIIRCGIIVAWGSAVLMIVVGVIAGVYKPISSWTSYLIFICIFSMVRSILSLYVKANNQVFLFGIDTVLYNLLFGVLNVIFLAFLSLRVSGYFGAYIIALFCSIILLSIGGKISLMPRYYSGDREVIKSMIVYSAPLIINSISWMLMSLVDRVMLTAMYSSGANGIYAVSTKVPTLLTVLAGVFTQAWRLSFVKDFDSERDNKFYSSVFGFFHLIVLLGTSVILMFTNNVFRMIIGDEFSDAVRYIPILMIGTVFLVYSNFFSPVYSAVKKSKKIAVSSFVGLVINIVLNVILIPKYGIMGACIATAISYILIGIYRMIDCRKFVDFEWKKNKWVVSIALLLAQSIVVVGGKYDTLLSICIMIALIILYRSCLGNLFAIIVGKFIKR